MASGGAGGVSFGEMDSVTNALASAGFGVDERAEAAADAAFNASQEYEYKVNTSTDASQFGTKTEEVGRNGRAFDDGGGGGGGLYKLNPV